MEGRGRKSSASLSVVATGVPQRMEPQSDLTESQAQLWRDVVNTKPVDWFAPDSAPLLAEYVRGVDMCNRLALLIEAATAGGEVGEVKALLDMRDKESRRVTSLATKMRLSQQSRYTDKAAGTADRKAGKDRPWQFGS